MYDYFDIEPENINFEWDEEKERYEYGESEY